MPDDAVAPLGDLTEAEAALWRAFPTGTEVDLHVGDLLADGPAAEAVWGPQRTIRAEVIVALVLGSIPAEPGHVAAVRVRGALIKNRLDLSFAQVNYLVQLHECYLPQRVILHGANLRQVNFARCHLAGLDAALCVIDGNLDLTRCTSGSLRLTGIRVGGSLLLNRSRISRQGSVAILANRADIGDDVICNGMDVTGEVRLAGARVGGMLDFNDASLNNPDGRALNAFRLAVGAYLRFRRNFSARGEITLTEATIGGSVEFMGAQLVNPDRDALAAIGIAVKATMDFTKGFNVNGATVLTGARIGGSLRFEDIRLLNPGGTALECRHVHASDFTIVDLGDIEGTVDLSYSQFDVIYDDPTTWPHAIRLDGLVYNSLEPRLKARQRLNWLDRDPGGYQPYTYEQLAGAFRRIGDDESARTVLYVKQCRRRATLPIYARLWGYLQDVTVGYGYRPIRAGGWLLLLLIIGTTVFGLHHPPGSLNSQVTAFNPLIYTIDLLIPFADLGQRHAFGPSGAQRWLAYGLIMVGWILVTTVAAGITRALRRP